MYRGTCTLRGTITEQLQRCQSNPMSKPLQIYGPMSLYEWHSTRQALLRFLIDKRVKVSLFLQRKWQDNDRSEEHTSELQSLMRISYAVFCLKKKKQYTTRRENHN